MVSQKFVGVLREQFWCRLEGPSSFVHIGCDCYMYVGVSKPCNRSLELSTKLGLFAEPMSSPYSGNAA